MPNDAYFQGNPIRLDTSRCRFHRNPRWTGSWVVGKLVPIYANSTVMPGDSMSVSIASAVRMTTPVFPVMDDMDITIEAYFVPHRLVLSRKSMSPDVNDSNHSWDAFIGAQDSLLNMPTPGDVKLPFLWVTHNDYQVGSLGDCLGFAKPATSGKSYQVNCLKTLAYYSIWNEYWREPNCQSPVTYQILGNGTCALAGSDALLPYSSSQDVGGFPLAPVSRYHGYFGSALPWPQRNTTAVQLPLGSVAPVITGPDIPSAALAGNPVVKFASQGTGNTIIADGTITAYSGGMALNGTGTAGNSDLVFKNLYADLSTATAATVNQFRLAVQTQRWYEALARGGNSSYSEMVNSMFGVRNTAVRDRPEYLGGFTAPISISQVAATTASTGQDLGKTGAFSLSNPSGFLFSKSFTEHGTVMIVATCRVRDSFCQGISRVDTKFDRMSFYWPQFASLGEQPILEKEVYVTGVPGNNDDDKVFGYQEAWAEYRMEPDLVTGYAKPTVTGGISYLTYCNNFSTAPTLKGFLDAAPQKDLVDNTLAVTSASAGFQLYGQFQFDINWIRPMPLYSIPGLVDHH